MSNPPVDRSQLWTNSERDTSEEARLASIQADEARKQYFGAQDDFAKKQAESAMLAQQRALGDAQYQAGRYETNKAFVDKHNEPILAEIRAAEEKRTTQLLTGVVAGVAVMAGAEATMSAMTNPAGTEPMGLTSMFARTLGLPGSSPVQAFSSGPTEMFNARSADAAKVFGMAPTLAIDSQPAMGRAPVMAEVAPQVADPANPIAAPGLARPRPGNALKLELDLADGPKPPSWATARANNGGLSS